MKTFCKLTAQSPAASYVPLPRFLLQDEALRDISNDAKVLYALLLDRASISRQNGYVEPDGTIRLYFTLEQAQTKLHRSRQSATRIFREAGRAKYCPACAKEVHRQQKAKSARKRRSGVDNLGENSP